MYTKADCDSARFFYAQQAVVLKHSLAGTGNLSLVYGQNGKRPLGTGTVFIVVKGEKVCLYQGGNLLHGG